MTEAVDGRRHLFVGGAWVEPAKADVLDVVDPTTEQVIAQVPAGTAPDVDRAVASARAAFPAWSACALDVRLAAVDRLRERLAERAEALAQLVVSEVGTPVGIARMVQVGLPLAILQTLPLAAVGVAFEEEVGNSLVVREPIGVVGCITPWNYPLHQVLAKVAPALVAGCTVVVKPSEVAPLNAFALAEAAVEAGLPAGVLNVVTGTGRDVGEPLAAHPGVDMISFTGSTAAGRRVAAVAADTVKRVALELGGKSANVVLDDADVQQAVGWGVANAFLNSGQTCTAPTRLLVPAGRHDELVELAVAVAQSFAPGDPRGEDTKLGPLVSAAQRERVRAYIRSGVADGARLVSGGDEAPDGLDRGYFVRPTVFAGVDTTMTIAREEIFGPVLAVLPYEDDDDAVRIADDSPYGLSGAVWGSPERALGIARRMRTGQVSVNGGRFNPLAPFGGYRQSGLGRELGSAGIEEFLETKAIQR